MPIRLFSSVTVREVDDLALQPLDVTVTMNARTNGVHHQPECRSR
jgi:hypothetical protein